MTDKSSGGDVNHPYRTVVFMALAQPPSRWPVLALLPIFALGFSLGFYAHRGPAPVLAPAPQRCQTVQSVRVQLASRPCAIISTYRSDADWVMCDDGQIVTVRPGFSGMEPVLLCNFLTSLRDGGVQ